MGIVKTPPSLFSQLRAAFRKHDLDVSRIKRNENDKEQIDISCIRCSISKSSTFLKVVFDIHIHKFEMKFDSTEDTIKCIIAHYRALGYVKAK